MIGLVLMAQLQTFSVRGGSPEYYATIDVKGDRSADPVLGPGTVTLRSKKTGKVVQVIQMASIALFKKQISTSVVKGGRQPSLYDDDYSLIFEDFNFDGRQDLAICNGLNSGYGGPSYDVFLFDRKSSKFVKNRALTMLASENLGMFTVDSKRRTIHCFKKSGAAWHSEETFKMAGDMPVLVKVVIDDATGEKEVITTKTMTGKGWKTTKVTKPHP